MTSWCDFWIGTFFALICLTWLASMIIAIAALCQYFG